MVIGSTSTGDYPLFILYGSATGNAEHIAKQLAALYEETYLKNNNNNTKPLFDSVICCEADQFKKRCLPKWDIVPSTTNCCKQYGLVIVASTTGNGDAPENCTRFVRYIKHKDTIAKKPFSNIKYTVLALGDTNYDKFCENGKIIDKKLTESGANRIQPIVCADEGTGCLEDVVDPWIATILPIVINACKGDNNNNNSTTKSDTATVPIEATDPIPVSTTTVSTTITDGTIQQDQQIPVESSPTIDTLLPILENNSLKAPSIGVQLVRSILEEQHQGDDNTNTVQFMDPSIFNTATTTTVSSNYLNKCTLVSSISQQQQQQQLSRSDTVESVMDDDQYYNINNPHAATIHSARYLTQTTPVIQNDNDRIVTVDNLTTTAQGWTKINQTIDEMYPLVVTTETNDETKTSSISLLEQTKRVIELKLSLPKHDSTNNKSIAKWQYQPGDSIGIIVPNPPSIVNFVRSNVLFFDETYTKTTLVLIDNEPLSSSSSLTIEEILFKRLDLSTSIHSSPMKRLLLGLSELATDPCERWCLQGLASKLVQFTPLYQRLVIEQRLNFVDLIHLFPSTYQQKQITIEWLINMIPSIPPRYYSVCSSPLCNTTNPYVTIAFSAVDYITPSLQYDSSATSSSLSSLNDDGTSTSKQNFGCRRINGLATRYLEVLALPFLIRRQNDAPIISTIIQQQYHVQIFPKPTTDFILPESVSIPLVLIGPGTGVAPFIGFLQHRQLQQQQQKQQQGDTEGSIGSIDLYFGCRYQDHDWLYKDEMLQYEKDGILSKLHVAFSRDVGTPSSDSTVIRKKYVQHHMEQKECSARLLSLVFEHNAIVYICGDGNQMAKDVQLCWKSILQQHFLQQQESSEDNDSNVLAEKKAEQYLEQMKDDKRFLLDIWS